MFGKRIRFRAIFVAVSVLALAGCSAVYRNHGYTPSDDDLALIQVGVDSRQAVAETIGSPSTGGVLTDGDFYYVRSRVKSVGIRKPEVTERQVLAISFDANDKVQNIERFDLKDGKIVPLSRRVTSSSVENKGFLRQLLGNLGRFSASNFLD